MRNIMLAATAIAGFGVLAAGAAQAQMPNQGIVTTSPSLPGFSGSFPEPGTINVYIRSRLLVDMGYASDSETNLQGSNNTKTKTAGTTIQEWYRLYPGFDAKTNRGLEYGAALEIREENATGTSQSSTSPATGGGTQFSVNSTTGSALYMRREGAYIGTATVGRLWFGETDGAADRLVVGALDGFYDTDGGWLGGAAYMINTNARLDYGLPAATGAWYGSNKIVYVSPVLAGFDFAASYEPNLATGQSSCATAPLVNNCMDVASAISTSSVVVVSQRHNTFEAALRYRGSFGPAAVAAEVATIQSGTVTTNGWNTATVAQSALVSTSVLPTATSGYEVASAAKTKGLNVIDAGLKVSAYGATVAGHYMGGAMNSDDSLIRHGQKNAQDFIFNANYVMGPVTVGVQYLNQLSAGFGQSYANGQIANGSAMLHQVGFGIGGSFDYAPGAQLWVSGLYGYRHQAGVDIQSQANYTASNYSTSAGSSNSANSLRTNVGNSTVARAVAVGNTFAF